LFALLFSLEVGDSSSRIKSLSKVFPVHVN
jgi:hypothetical protein